MKQPNFQATQWIAWLGATIVAAGTLTAFAFQNFATKDQVREDKVDVIHRFDRVDNKLDEIYRKLNDSKTRP